MGRHLAVLLVITLATAIVAAQTGSSESTTIVLRPARVFDGQAVHEGWAVRVVGDRIDAAGPSGSIATQNARVVDLAGFTLTPGLVEGHSHVLLHPYNEAAWEFQVAHEPLALRTARAVNHLRATLMAGFTTIRDLGTEGAGYADVGLRDAIDQGIIPGPRVLASTRAIVATGAYDPKFVPEWNAPQGAEEADGVESITRVVSSQIGKGRELDQVLRGLSMGARRNSASDLHAGVADRRRSRRTREWHARGGPRHKRRRHAQRHHGRR
jgi:hypothetical protein